MSAERFIAKIDSSSTILLAIAHYLRGKDIAGLGFIPTSLLLGALANMPPKFLRQIVYIRGGRREATPPEDIPHLSEEEISRWVVDQYPKRPYPAVLVGSSNGALIHLCAALGIPWLPQTVLVPVRRKKRMHPDELEEDADAFKESAARFLERNPSMQINQMHDPIQDRLMIQQMGYFRIKRLRLGETYERFLRECLLPGGTLFIADCTYSWPMTEIGPRHFFQIGGYGGLEADEYLHGSPRVAEFLKKHRSPVQRWDPPPIHTTRPEAEWGLEQALAQDLQRFSGENHYRLRRISFQDPADPSPLAADFYRWWYKKRSIQSSRLLAESFLLLDPWWCLRTGSIPFWMVFNTGRSAKSLEQYVKDRGPFDEIYLTLFANSVEGIDQTTIPEWRGILRQARVKSDLVGLHEKSYPYDLGVYFRFHPDLKRKIAHRLPMPTENITLAELDQFLATHPASTARVRWSDEARPLQPH